MATSPIDQSIEPLNLREQIARIDQLQADAARKRQETRFAPWQIIIAASGTGAALFAAGAAFTKIVIG